MLGSKIRATLVGLVALLVVGSYAATAASAAVQGPWWMKLEGGKQVKIEPKPHLEIKSLNEGAFILKSTILAIPVILECRSVKNSGSIWNGPHTGRDEAEVKWGECFVATSTSVCKGFPIVVSTTNVRTELMWKYAGTKKELEEAGGGQKIYDVFAPKTAPEEFKEGEKTGFRAPFTTIKIPKEVEGLKCALANEAPGYTVYARGKKYSGWEDQEGATHEVQWGTAALVEPQNEDMKAGTLKWVLPNVKKLHVEGVEEEAKLELGANAAELQGTIKVEATNGITEFGAWNKV
jgi:hypothetical protein